MKKLTLVLCVLALLGSGTSAVFYIQIGNSKQLLQQQLTQVEARATTLDAEARTAQAEKEQLQKRLTSVDDDLAETKSRLTLAGARSTQNERELSQLRQQLAVRDPASQARDQEIAELRRQLADVKNAHASALAAAAAPSADELERFRQTVASQDARIADLQTQLAARPTALAAAPPVPMQPEAITPQAPAVDPELLTRAERTIASLEERIRLLQREINSSEAREAAAVAAAGRAIAAAANAAGLAANAAPTATRVAPANVIPEAAAPSPVVVAATYREAPLPPAPAAPPAASSGDLSTAIVAATAPADDTEPSARPTAVLTSRVRPTQVITVGAQNAFVVLNYGQTQGAVADQQFLVKRGTEIIATVQISDVRPNYSVAQVVPDTLRGALRKGDSAAIVAH